MPGTSEPLKTSNLIQFPLDIPSREKTFDKSCFRLGQSFVFAEVQKDIALRADLDKQMEHLVLQEPWEGSICCTPKPSVFFTTG